MCLNRKRVTRYYPGLKEYRNQYFPCGHCIECLRQKQNATAFLISREADESGSLIFLTWTYAPEHLPFAHTEQVYDVDSGQLIEQLDPVQVCDATYSFGARYDKVITFDTVPDNHRSSAFRRYRRQLLDREDLIRQDYLTLYGRRAINPHLLRDYETDQVRICGYVCPTLRTSDVQLVIKLFRTRCARKGINLDGFKYFVCGEYGTKSGRPHYHLAVHGISRDLAIDLCALWEGRFGSTYLDPVNFDGRSRVADYIGKYMTKGEFDCPFVKEKLCFKSRRQSSQSYGTDNLSAIRSYVLGYDVFGKYDVSDPKTYPSNISDVVSLVLSRNSIQLNGIRYSIPRIIKRKILYAPTFKLGDVSTVLSWRSRRKRNIKQSQSKVPERGSHWVRAVARKVSDTYSPHSLRDYRPSSSCPRCKHIKVYRPTALSALCSHRLQVGYDQDFNDQLRQAAFHYSSEDLRGPALEVCCSEEMDRQSRSVRAVSDLRSFYKKSLF